MTLATRVIPCLDVDDGRVVKGVNFQNLRDAGDPVELAARYDAEGADELTFLDVTASSSGRATMIDVVHRTADAIFIPLTVGGGIRTVDDVALAMSVIAVADPGQRDYTYLEATDPGRAVVALAEIANKKHQRGEPSQNLAYAAAGLTIVNAAIAFLW